MAGPPCRHWTTGVAPRQQTTASGVGAVASSHGTVSPAHLDRLVTNRRCSAGRDAVGRRVGEALVVYSDEEFGRVYREAFAGREELRRRSGRGRRRLEQRPHPENLLQERQQGL